jgi:hypothetical protein
MEFIIGDRYGTRRSNLTRIEAKRAGEVLQKHAVTVTAIVETGGYVLRAVFADRTVQYFRTVREVEQLDERRGIEWMLRNGVTIMLGKGD